MLGETHEKHASEDNSNYPDRYPQDWYENHDGYSNRRITNEESFALVFRDASRQLRPNCSQALLRR